LLTFAMPASSRNLLTTLRDVRAAKRVSQLELSFRLGVSQRHVSFVESGRAKPSRALLVAWLQALNAPLAVCNEVMLEAGFAPLYGDSSMSDPELAHATDALSHLLQAHDPMPAFVIDSAWNVRQANAGAQWLMLALLPWLAQAPSASLNMLDLMAHPDGLLTRMVNLRDVGPALLAHLRDDAAVYPALLPKADAVAAALRDRLGDGGDTAGAKAHRADAGHALRLHVRHPVILKHAHHVRDAPTHHAGVPSRRTPVCGRRSDPRRHAGTGRLIVGMGCILAQVRVKIVASPRPACSSP
jgi:transcriptional regulator with XRE-family HTH domain